MFWYGIGQMAEGVKSDSFAIFLLFYYREVLGLSGFLAGLALMISLAADAITDPLIGALSDRTRSRFGRRHPYMAVSALPVAVTYYLAFVPPEGLSQVGLFGWLVTFTVLARSALTLFVVPYMALGAELSVDYNERTAIVTTRTAFATFGRALPSFFGFVVFMRPTEDYPNGQLNPGAYPPYALLTAVLIFVPIVLSVLGTRSVAINSQPPPLNNAAAQGHDPILSSIARDFVSCLRIRNFRVHFFGSTVAFVAWGIMGSMGLHLATHFWHVSTEILMLWGFGMFSGMFAGLVFWNKAATTHEKRDVFVRGLGMYMLFTVPPVFLRIVGIWPSEGTPLYITLYVLVLGFLAHFGIAATMATGGSMMADITDEDELLHGKRREGVFFGAISFAAKSAIGIGAQIAGLVLDAVGLVPGSKPEDVPPDVVRNLGLVLGFSVLVIVGIAMRIYMRYDLDRTRLSTIRAELKPAE